MSPGILKEKAHLFIGKYSEENKTKNGGGVAAENEEIQIVEYPFDEAFKMIETQEIIDARTIMLLQHLKINDIM